MSLVCELRKNSLDAISPPSAYAVELITADPPPEALVERGIDSVEPLIMGLDLPAEGEDLPLEHVHIMLYRHGH
jgi:hypothetical protein